MARKTKGATVYFDHSLKEQLSRLLKEMQLTEQEVIEVMKSTTVASAAEIQNEINGILKKHKDTGETLKYAIKPEAKVEVIGKNLLVSADVGIKLTEDLDDMKHGEGGYGALLIDYGTPKGPARGSKRGPYKKDGKSEPKKKSKTKAKPREITNAIRRGRTRAMKRSVIAFQTAVQRRLGK